MTWVTRLNFLVKQELFGGLNFTFLVHFGELSPPFRSWFVCTMFQQIFTVVHPESERFCCFLFVFVCSLFLLRNERVFSFLTSSFVIKKQIVKCSVSGFAVCLWYTRHPSSNMKLLLGAALLVAVSCSPANVFTFSQYNPAGEVPFEEYWQSYKNTHGLLKNHRCLSQFLHLVPGYDQDC